MANWRRERDHPIVHITPDAAPALCGLDRDALGTTVWDAQTAAPEMCAGCSHVMLAKTHDAIARVAAVLEAARGHELTYEPARQAMRELIRIVPAGGHADRAIYARACLARNDSKDAEASLRLWRDEMRAMLVMP